MKGIVAKVWVISFFFYLTLASSAVAKAQYVMPASYDGKISAAEALSRYEKLLLASTEQGERLHLTMKAAPTALAAGESDKAKAYALSLLQQADTPPHNLYNGDAIHVGNIVLGLIALASDDRSEAKRRLLEAGKSQGSPVLNSFGPDMRLAKELLAKGEREVVIQYFELCTVFWKFQYDKLIEWRAIVIKGRIPKFGPNLVYVLDAWRQESWYKYGF
jgi:hypothetical protein